MSPTKLSSYGAICLLKIGKDTRLLVVQQKAGHWGFPKGTPIGIEAPIETAQRELLEETGIAATLKAEPTLQHTYNFTTDNGSYQKTVHYYLCQIENPRVKIQTDEINDFRWVSLHQARRLLPANMNALLTKLTPFTNRESLF